jgi:hypothetical protein
MFFKGSRYKTLENVVIGDKSGHSFESKSLRIMPEVVGTFEHVIEEVDRLDHLAYKYFKKPVNWWHICDANPDFLSPLALLGKDPIVTAGFAITYDNPGPAPLYKILVSLNQLPGVRDVSILDEGQTVTVIYNRATVDAETLIIKMKDDGFTAADPVMVGRLGKKIIIPPDAVG